MRARSRRTRWLVVPFVVVLIGVAFVLLNGEALRPDAVSGTMSESSSTMMEAVDVSWSGEGTLDDELSVTVSVAARTGAERDVSVGLFFSRDREFDVEVDCRIDARDVAVGTATPGTVQLRTLARHVPCLDAGPWHAAVRTSDGAWLEIGDPIIIRNGPTMAEIASVGSDVIPRGDLNVELDIIRPVTETGYDGLYDYSVRVWLQQNDMLCSVETEPLRIERETGTRFSQTTSVTKRRLRVNLGEARRVDPATLVESPFSDVAGREEFIPSGQLAEPEYLGRCSLGQGPVQLTVAHGSARARVLETYHHAAPVAVETGTIRIQIPAGETLHVKRAAYNPSVDEVAWRTESVAGHDWLIGVDGRDLAPRAPSSVEFTVSAADLDPGIYRDSVRIRAQDYYGTEITLAVELDVLRARSIVEEEEPAVDQALNPGNYPNPFNPSTTIRFSLSERETVSLEVFDVAGRQIRLLHDGELDEGVHEFRFDAGDLPSGTYLYRIVTPRTTETRSMVLVK
ncbi:MAG: T9SS type A sorting domain-containing protein [Rhodothermales bacterium]|nr:T9SS type A sorting domain-containing protein [Rhodothermales bacterium]